MVMRIWAMAVTATVLLLLGGILLCQDTVQAQTPASPVDTGTSPLPLAVVDLQEVLTAAAQINAESPKDDPAAAPQRNDPQRPQKEQMRTAFTLAQQAAKDIAISRGCDVVLNIKARGASSQPGSGPVHPCYLAEPSDLTTDVIARLEARARQIEQPLPASATRPAVQPAVASVNVARVFDQMRHTRDLRAKSNKRQQASAQEEAEYRAKFRTLKQQYDQAAQDSPERKDLQAKLTDATAAHDARQKAGQRDMIRDQTIAMRDIFQEIATAAAELGRRRGCWLLLVATRSEVPEDISYLQPDQLRSIIASTTILYSAPQADLTNELLQILDAQYTGQPVPWPTTQPTHASQLPVRIIDQAEVTRRTGLSPTRLETAISPLATQRGYTLVFPAIRPKLPENVDNVDLGQLRTLINSINLLYADPAADISADLAPSK